MRVARVVEDIASVANDAIPEVRSGFDWRDSGRLAPRVSNVLTKAIDRLGEGLKLQLWESSGSVVYCGSRVAHVVG